MANNNFVCTLSPEQIGELKLRLENGSWEFNGKPVTRLNLAENVEKYAGHEIAAHALTHPDLTKLSIEEARREMAEDKEGLGKKGDVLIASELLISESLRFS